ncbi:zeta toxin family protein [Simplicispira metamorpha]|uniref:Putative ABC-type ATPase n=1 Tax=Simplicispira metamorpha TaxID=80881 RepID=A0A4R2NEM4_9BURK|nr:zeta toxin family protein [Simplicispira metamorpha]TCP19687.1 putative ABC-type ATPase [Simplicispira metamorpha]
MNAPVPRLRMFAGPNGSGKSTIKEVLPSQWLGVYINADEIEKTVRADSCLNLATFEVKTDTQELQAFLQASSLLKKAGLLAQVSQLTLVDGCVVFGPVVVNSYWASVLADFIRHKLLALKVSFTFETVMSSPDKVAFLQKAQQAGYRTYLYFVATEDADINVSRVKYRVQVGGHPVAEDKIRSRYVRSLELLPKAVAHADRAYIFDNSGAERVWVAEVTDGLEIEMKTDEMPAWFKVALWDQFE